MPACIPPGICWSCRPGCLASTKSAVDLAQVLRADLMNEVYMQHQRLCQPFSRVYLAALTFMPLRSYCRPCQCGSMHTPSSLLESVDKECSSYRVSNRRAITGASGRARNLMSSNRTRQSDSRARSTCERFVGLLSDVYFDEHICNVVLAIRGCHVALNSGNLTVVKGAAARACILSQLRQYE